MDITLAICTRNRANQLDACLKYALVQQCSLGWEILVVDSASTDRTPEVLARWLELEPTRLRVIRLEEPGTGRARRAASEQSTSPILAFTDDDCYVEPDYLSCIHEIFNREAALGCIGTRILLHDPADAPITICESLTRVVIARDSVVHAGFIQGAGMAVRRAALTAAGGFDVRLGPGTPFVNEDVDIAARINAAGWDVSYEPAPAVRHHHGRKSNNDVLALTKRYDHGRGAFFARMILDGHWQYVKAWAIQARYQPLSASRRELAGAIHFMLHSIRHSNLAINSRVVIGASVGAQA